MRTKLVLLASLVGLALAHFPLTAVAQPVATTLAATSIGPTNATLNGTVNPSNAVAVAYFQYGLTTNYDNLGGFRALPATNTAQTLPGFTVNALFGPAGANWVTTSAPGINWYSIASSADGTRLAAVVYGGGIYTSTNAGGTWTQTTAPSTNWYSIASSADGTRLAALVYGGGIYTSTNGGGAWTLTSAPGTNWYSIASSADGTRLAAVAAGGGIYTSTNGSAWTLTTAPTNNWNCIASSADGLRLAATVANSGNTGAIYTSTNAGATWTLSGARTTLIDWLSIASSADGTHLAAVDHFGFHIWTSSDGGNSWTVTSAPNNVPYFRITSSADGTRLAVAATIYPGLALANGVICTSTDGGATWTQTSAPSEYWSSIASSADGSQLAAVVSGSGGIFTSTGPANNLTPGTTCHFRAVGLNNAGTGPGIDRTFTTSATAPSASTLAASGITATNATFNALVNPNGAATSAYFEYGLTTNYGSHTATNALAATNVTLSVSNFLNLTPLTTYHFQLVASNVLGTTLGGDLTVTTPPLPPVVTTLSATSITTTSGTLNGTVNPNGAATTAYFQFGLTTNYGSYTATNTLAATNSTLSVSNLISGLAPGTAYHYHLVAGNSGGASAGNDLTFTTSAGAPTATTGAATGVTATNATLTGSLFTGDLNTSAYFQYGFTTNYGSYSATNALAATNVSVSVSNLVSNLTPNQTYHFRLVATNSAGTSVGNDLTLVPPLPPVVTTLAATGITISNATLNGSVNPENVLAAAYFQYGLTSNYDNLGALRALPATNTAQTLPGLVVNALHGPAGINWTNPGAPSLGWFSIASSADGTRLAAVVWGGGIYTSTNSGGSWTLTSAPGSLNWESIASSADGLRLAAVPYPSSAIYTSTNGGVTWITNSAPTADYIAIASSADGTRLAAAATEAFAGGVYTSTNGGLTWTQTAAPALFYTSIASSADGTRLAAVLGGSAGNGIYVSTNAGVTWTQTDASYKYNSVASSADGMRVVAVADNGVAFISTDGGLTWQYTQPGGSYLPTWTSVASSADGMRLAIAAQNGNSAGGIFTSTDGGQTWSGGTEYNVNWRGLASSADGSQLAAAAYGGGIITSSGTTSPLIMGATYHYRAVGLNSAGTGLGNDLTFTIPAPPSVVTLAATGVTSTNATLNGLVNPNGAATSAYFRYGLTTNYGSYSATNTLPATNVTLSVSNLVGSLTLGTTYHFQLVAGNSVGTNAGSDLTLTTLAQPDVTTLAATGISSTNATFNGTVNPNGAAATAYFRYGLTTNYGSYTVTNALAATNVAVSVSNSVGALTPGTTYHFQLVAGNSVGTNAGLDLTFTTAPVAPNVTTLAATGVSSTNATLNGTVNPNGAATSAYFRFGLTTNYGSYSATNTLTATNATLSVSNLITGLAPGTTYHFQLVAGNSVGTNAGADLTFTTAPVAPTVTTLGATGVSSTNATLNGTVNPNGATTSAYFRFGLTTNYGSYSATNNLVATNVALSVSNLVGGLTPGTLYHYQLVAGNTVGTNTGSDLTFTTAPVAPTVTTLAATGVSSTNATLNGTVNPNGAATSAYFRYGLTTGYGSLSATNNLSATNITLAVSNLFGSLTPGTLYHFQLVASNSVGANAGADLTFTTAAAAPTVTTLAASSVSATNATLNGTVKPNGAATAAYFRYGLTTNYGSFSATNSLAATNVTLSVSNLVGSLTPGTTYHFQLVASNSMGATAGADLTFTTGAAAPAPTTLAATSVSSSSATLNGTANPNGAATSAYFRYGLTTNYGSYSATNNLSATNVTLSVSNLVGSLTPGTTYHFQLVAGNSVGTNSGADLTFTTGPAVPAATTLAASTVTATNATLNGTVNPNGGATSAYFQYGLTTNYGSYSGTNSLAATNSSLSVANLISSLTPGTTYHFQLVAGNSVGTNSGVDMQFTTPSQAVQAVSFNLNGAVTLPSGAFQFSFTNLSGLSFSVLASTDLALPLSNWTVLGTPLEGPPGQYQFTDPQATNSPARFYRVRSP